MDFDSCSSRNPEPAFGHAHVVHVYESDPVLVRCVVAFLAPALLGSEASLVVATPEHLALFDHALRTGGLDLPSVRSAGRYVELDAEETLSSFMSGGQIDADAFDGVVGERVRALAAQYDTVSVYGEMVACLWSRDEVATAVTLERLWNDLARSSDFRLCCGYPMTVIGARGSADEVEQMFGAHSEVAVA